MSLPSFQFGLDFFETGVRFLLQFDAFAHQFDRRAASLKATGEKETTTLPSE